MKQIVWSSETTEKFKEFEASLRVDHIGIHAAPGSKFCINGSGEFIIGGTGIFEINLKDKGSYIYSVECLEDRGHFILIDYSGKGVVL